MADQPSDSNYHPSPTRSDRRSHQARSQKLPPTKLADSSPSTKYKTSSFRLLRESSLNLFSLISKFETLDVLGLPVRIKTAQPAPLQTQQNSTKKRAGTGATHQKRLSTIFCPGNRSQENYGDVFLENEYIRQEESFRKPSAAFCKFTSERDARVREWAQGFNTLQVQQHTIAWWCLEPYYSFPKQRKWYLDFSIYTERNTSNEKANHNQRYD